MQIDGKMEQNDHTLYIYIYSLLHSYNCHRYMYSANESSTYMTSVGKGGEGAQQKVSHQHIFFLSRALPRVPHLGGNTNVCGMGSDVDGDERNIPNPIDIIMYKIYNGLLPEAIHLF